MNSPDMRPVDGQLVRVKFGGWTRPGKGRTREVHGLRYMYMSLHVGRYFAALLGRRGEGVYGRKSDGSRGKLMCWSSVVKWEPWADDDARSR